MFIALDDLEYWGKERVPTPDYKLENNKPFLLPRLPHKYDSSNIETTSYALMIYVARQEVVLMQRIVRWLNSQRLYDGGWASTQVSKSSIMLHVLRSFIQYLMYWLM